MGMTSEERTGPYDVIVVGAGSAGCVVASRLSENPNRSVLLLEAGPDYPDESLLPADIASGLIPTVSHDWGYASESGLLGRSLPLPRAKVVGGCSATNGTIALRGSPADYNDWAERGNSGWSFADVLPFFRRLERDLDFDGEWHGNSGPIPILRQSMQDLTSTNAAFLQSCGRLGHAGVADHNAPGAIGAGPVPMNCIAGRRQSTAITYLAQARSWANLHIRSATMIDRVVFEGRRAVGVRLAGSPEVIGGGHIILAAGAYGSPAILLRSGLGPADHLRGLGIEPLQDMPGVGQNLIDHPYLGLIFAVKQSELVEGVPYFQAMLTARSAAYGDGHDLHILPTTVFNQSADASTTDAVMVLLVSVVKQGSRGRLQLHSSDPLAPPRIDLGYFSHPGDMPRMIEAVRMALELAHTPPLSDLIVQDLYPSPQTSRSAEDLEQAIRGRVETYHHPVGTCGMGSSTDAEAVVDARGRVHGVEGLSIVDASIMPSIPAANTNVPTIMVAERVAAWLAPG
jgi:choline dehydrogenase